MYTHNLFSRTQEPSLEVQFLIMWPIIFYIARPSSANISRTLISAPLYNKRGFKQFNIVIRNSVFSMPNFDNLSNSSGIPYPKFWKFKKSNTKYYIQAIFMVILFVDLFWAYGLNCFDRPALTSRILEYLTRHPSGLNLINTEIRRL